MWVKQKLDSILDYYSSENLFSGMVLIQKYDHVLYIGNYNWFSDDNIQYKIGSVTKVFTAIIIYQLIEEGKLALTTTLDRFFPDVKHSSGITIDNMLSHTSGIYSVTDWEGYYASRSRNFNRQDVLNLIYSYKPSFKPGKDCSYSNSNYILLGYVIEDITGKSYAQNVEERISGKLGMKSTYCETSTHRQPPGVHSYKFNGESWIQDVDSDPGFPGAAGAIISTTEDLGKMMYGLFNQELISDSSLAVMKKLVSRSVGHGLFKAPFYNRTGWGHTGRIDEYRSFAGYFPGDSLILTVTSNGMNTNLNDLIIAVLSAYYGHSYKYPEPFGKTVETPSLNLFTGLYKARLFGFIPVGKLEITLAGRNFLFMNEYHQGQESEKALLERKDEYVFYSRDARNSLTFITNSQGKIKGIIMKQGPVKIKCRKLINHH
jgi:D-alanyl-D-alanine carboxypeptidase